MNKILKKCRRLSPKRPFDQNEQNNKFKMAAATILNFIYRSQLVYYCK